MISFCSWFGKSQLILGQGPNPNLEAAISGRPQVMAHLSTKLPRDGNYRYTMHFQMDVDVDVDVIVTSTMPMSFRSFIEFVVAFCHYWIYIL